MVEEVVKEVIEEAVDGVRGKVFCVVIL